MGETEVIKGLMFLKEKLYNGIFQDRLKCIDLAIAALEEVQKYRQIGTVEECREAVKNYKSTVCSSAEKDSDGKCLGYGKSDIDDEPCKICKNCKESTGYLEVMENE